MARKRPRVFIASSSEGLEIAKAIQLELDRDCEVEVWSQGLFSLSVSVLDSLISSLDTHDFAIIVVTPDDLVETRNRKHEAPRDNVIFELGLFMGAIGRSRTYIIHDRTKPLKLPSDLDGITKASFEPHSSGNLQAALGAPCTEVKNNISRIGPRPVPEDIEIEMTPTVSERTYRQKGSKLLHSVLFDYTDQPDRHGWQVNGSIQIAACDHEGTGQGLAIAPDKHVKMDYTIPESARQTKYLEIVTGKSRMWAYARVTLAKDDGSSKQGWIALLRGDQPPKKFNRSEWWVYIPPDSLRDGLFCDRISLTEVMRVSFSTEGWHLLEVTAIRIGGGAPTRMYGIYLFAEEAGD